ncbi:MAG: beta-N-acetylhexosaminidase, partial [Sphingobacteriales bacterium]
MCKVFKVLFISLLLSYTCAAQMPQLIPQPVSIKTLPGHLTINPKTTIIVYTGDNGGREMGDLLAKLLSTPMGYHLQVKNKNRNLQATALPNTISVGINLNKKEVLGDEGYTLKSTKGNVAIRANTPKGLFYGLQTLLQLLPPSIEGDKKVQTAWTVPAVEITDYPRFGWRGLMRDVSRHFFTKENIKSYIDQMAKYKFNVFHWHLTDDNGWRIQINGLPQLTDIGAWRVPRAGPFLFTAQKGPEPDEMATYGGFYTQDDIREVVKYAQERFITIVPEVDVPAHSMALIASFPNLSCLGIKNPVDVGTEFTVNKDNVLCVANDSTYLILDKIFTQVAQLFPGEYIHMG